MYQKMIMLVVCALCMSTCYAMDSNDEKQKDIDYIKNLMQSYNRLLKKIPYDAENEIIELDTIEHTRDWVKLIENMGSIKTIIACIGCNDTETKRLKEIQAVVDKVVTDLINHEILTVSYTNQDH